VNPPEASEGGTQQLSGPAPQFVDIAATAGIEFTFDDGVVPNRFFLPEIMGGGVGWVDFDRDGWFDLYLSNGTRWPPDESAGPPAHDRVFRQSGQGEFVDVSATIGVTGDGYGQGVAVGDFDADGFDDLYVANYGPDALLMNVGDGTYLDVTNRSGIHDDDWSSSCLWIDIDGDLLLDLYVTTYMDVTVQNCPACNYGTGRGYCGPGWHEAVPDRILVNDGGGQFVDRTAELGFAQENGKGLAVAAADLDGDCRPEIYVANDMCPNFLFTRAPAESSSPGRNQYREVAAAYGCALSGDGKAEASMGIAVADFNGDQRPDLFVTNYYQEKNTLYENLGGLLFRDGSNSAGLPAISYNYLGFGTVPLDYDGDGAIDLFVTNGHVLGPLVKPSEMTPQLLRNDGQGRFQDVSKWAGDYFLDLWLGRGTAGADFDNDGDLDLGVSHLQRPFALLENRTLDAPHFVGLLLCRQDRLPATGGRVRITTDSRVVEAPCVAGGSYLSTSDRRLLFSLRPGETLRDVAVTWDDDCTTQHAGVTANRYWRLSNEDRPSATFQVP
jgi:hypothetical protein